MYFEDKPVLASGAALARGAGRLALVVATVLAGLARPGSAAEPIQGQQGPISRSAVVNFSELAKQQQSLPTTGEKRQLVHKRPNAPRTLATSTSSESPSVSTKHSGTLAASLAVNSLAPTVGVSFSGLDDNGTVIPPDTMGAVGPNHLMTP